MCESEGAFSNICMENLYVNTGDRALASPPLARAPNCQALQYRNFLDR